MKPLYKFVVASLLFGAMSVNAETTISLQSEIQPLILNSADAEDASAESGNNLLLIEEGTNQLLFKVGQLVSEDAKHRKYNSPAFIIRFEASDRPLELSYPKLRTIADAKAFERSPSFTLVNDANRSVDFSIDKLTAGGLQNLRDYQNELVAYNQRADAIAAVSSVSTTSTVSTSTANKVASGESQPMSVTNSSSRMNILQGSFSQLSAQEQQEFMLWAMKNLKD
ncbi:DUF2057 domain-containing protein [Photobacterium rosenbergii]|uniref:DUF2057 domain-containing protein n=1 Tax=Photobacterium rosenbergii TaxID=294936 RepID=A0ABU3ZM79_9GAMM|nr:DUF2057 domain-containing protein [Photobacterium rosenbergii]MDV5171156.1 DUF2057 domain-containing protein [Photobacterium rosenbergii]